MEKQLEFYKGKARDVPLISNLSHHRFPISFFSFGVKSLLPLLDFFPAPFADEADRIHELEVKLMEQHERLFQVEEANKRLKKEAKQGGQTLSADNLVVRALSPPLHSFVVHWE